MSWNACENTRSMNAMRHGASRSGSPERAANTSGRRSVSALSVTTNPRDPLVPDDIPMTNSRPSGPRRYRRWSPLRSISSAKVSTSARRNPAVLRSSNPAVTTALSTVGSSSNRSRSLPS